MFELATRNVKNQDGRAKVREDVDLNAQLPEEKTRKVD